MHEELTCIWAHGEECCKEMMMEGGRDFVFIYREHSTVKIHLQQIGYMDTYACWHAATKDSDGCLHPQRKWCTLKNIHTTWKYAIVEEND